MHKWYWKGSAGMTLLLALAVSPAQAALIDFTDGGWTSGTSRSIPGFGDVTVEAFDSMGDPTSLDDSEAGPGSTPPCDFLACDTDGLGVDGDEVTYGEGGALDVERIKVTTSEPFRLGRLHFLDLFADPDPGGGGTEVAEYRINGVNMSPELGSFAGYATDNVGYGVTDDLGIPNVTMIEFGASSSEFGFEATNPESNTDFAVAGITSVPTPATLLLLGGGLLGLAAAARRRA
jgi:hypothetical protein